MSIEGFDALLDFLIGKGFFLEQAVEIVEKGMIERALRQTNDNQLQAAKLLGIHRNTLQKKMVAYRIDGKPARRKPVKRAVTGKARRKRVA